MSGGMLTNGKHNVAIGSFAGFSNENDNYTVCIGDSAGYLNQEPYNIFLGFKSGKNNLGGSGNIFVGPVSGENNVFSDYNTFLGFATGANSDGEGNTFIGYQCGKENRYGYNNTYLGCQAGSTTEDGIGNTYLGYYAGKDNYYGDYNIYIGRYAGYSFNGSNELVIENSISANPLIYGKFDEDFVKINGAININGSKTWKVDIINENDFVAKHYYASDENVLLIYSMSNVPQAVTLPDASLNLGRVIHIKYMHALNYPLGLWANEGEYIITNISEQMLTLETGDSIELVSDGTNWAVLSLTVF